VCLCIRQRKIDEADLLAAGAAAALTQEILSANATLVYQLPSTPMLLACRENLHRTPFTKGGAPQIPHFFQSLPERGVNCPATYAAESQVELHTNRCPKPGRVQIR